ncbi:hypothetical protein AAMO2058_001540100 [Amorphochlora amoebiformis]
MATSLMSGEAGAGVQSVQNTTARQSENVRVALRARPLLAAEKLKESHVCCKFDQAHNHLSIGNRGFSFDHVYPPPTTQQEVYDSCVAPLVTACFQGYNATILAYGQTGAGKTYTMGSGNTRNISEDGVGIIPRVVRQIFRNIDSCKGSEVEVRVSYVEIHNEIIRDLLAVGANIRNGTPAISIREDSKSRIKLQGAREDTVSNYAEMMRFLERGSVARTTGSTLMNIKSSRSHAIFTITLIQRVNNPSKKRQIKRSKFHLIDLAGSERAKRTGAVGARFKESITINKGLLALGNVISALCASAKSNKRSHIPYRDSKLTRLLQDSLGGNSRTLIIACISPADVNFEESLTTLKYADRAKKIKNRAIINEEEDRRAFEVKLMQREINALTQKLAKLKPNDLARGWEAEMESLKSTLIHRENEISNLRKGRDWLLEGVESLINNHRDIKALEIERETVKERVLKLRRKYEKLSKNEGTPKEEISRLVKTIKSEQSSYLTLRSQAAKVREALSLTTRAYAHPRKTLSLPPSISERVPDEKRASIEISPEGGVPEERGVLGKGGGVGEEVEVPPPKGGGEGGEVVRVVKVLQEALAVESKRREEAEMALTLTTEDLARDDAIFEAKVSEIQSLNAKNQSLNTQLERLKREILTLEEKVASFSQKPKLSSPWTNVDESVNQSNKLSKDFEKKGKKNSLLEQLEQEDVVLQDADEFIPSSERHANIPHLPLSSNTPPHSGDIQSARGGGGGGSEAPIGLNCPKMTKSFTDPRVRGGGGGGRKRGGELGPLVVERARLCRELDTVQRAIAKRTDIYNHTLNTWRVELTEISATIKMKTEFYQRAQESGDDQEKERARSELLRFRRRESEVKRQARLQHEAFLHDKSKMDHDRKLLEREMSLHTHLIEKFASSEDSNLQSKAPFEAWSRAPEAADVTQSDIRPMTAPSARFRVLEGLVLITLPLSVHPNPDPNPNANSV